MQKNNNQNYQFSNTNNLNLSNNSSYIDETEPNPKKNYRFSNPYEQSFDYDFEEENFS